MDESTSGSDRHRATAMIAHEKRPSRPTSPMKVWIFGVYRNGTVSLLMIVGTLGVREGNISVFQIFPLAREKNNFCG
jgi:hypothetical protein